MKVSATKEEPIKPGWYVVERGWQRSPGNESFFGTHEGDVWWDEFEPSDFTKFLLRVMA